MYRILKSVMLFSLLVICGTLSSEAQLKAKATVYYSGFSGGKIIKCFNSTLAAPANTTPPCGFAATRFGVGDYAIDFGFKVSSRFFSIGGQKVLYRLCTSTNGMPGCAGTTVTSNQLEVISYYFGVADSKFYVVVF
jgi:hypothetical protein